MQTARVLSDDEKAYLAELFQEPAPEPDPVDSVTVEAEGLDQRQLVEMLRLMDAELVARDGFYNLQFKLEPAAAGAEGSALRLTIPEVLDHRGPSRSARVRPLADEVTLRDDSGRLRQPTVLDISNSGLALSAAVTAPAAPGTRLHSLTLCLPDRPPLSVSARVVRLRRHARTHKQFLGLQFEQLHASVRRELRNYVFRRYSV